MNAPDGTAHYMLALAAGNGGAISGSITYLYQDGRAATVGRYAGRLSAGGQLVITLVGGRVLDGTYGAGKLALAGCASVLTWAVHPGDCQFSYHGYAP